ncbi:PcfJ domain-containing protein [uncultured Dialister sp.]|uniref:PcfJ domain-containing protein n=1 Tax=uncultured Dialister sp. TaxID=278064 RepID=UPI0026DBE851|nr:PcfJ domain-containing protein [uncultured Dialister sp.]
MEEYNGKELPKTLAEVKAHFRHWERFTRDVRQFVLDRGLPNYMLIKPGTGREIGYCTHCEKQVDLEAGYTREERKKWRQLDTITCPECGAAVDVITNKTSRNEYCFFYWWEKSRLNPEAIVCRGIHAEREIKRETWEELDKGKKLNIAFELDDASVFIYRKGSVMACAIKKYEYEEGYSWKQKVTWKLGKVRGRSGVYANWSSTRYRRAGRSLVEAEKGTPFRWSEWEKWNEENDARKRARYSLEDSDWEIDRDVIFMARFSTYPSWEWLLKMGMGRALGEYTDRRGNEAWKILNFRGKNVDAIFRTKLTKEDKQYMLRGEIEKAETIGMLQQWRRYFPLASLEDVDWMAKHMPLYGHGWNSEKAHRIYSLTGPGRLRRYIEKQRDKMAKKGTKKENGDEWWRNCFHGEISMNEYVDYLEELEALKYNLSDKDNLFPPDFAKAHEHAAKALVAVKRKLEEEQWDKRKEVCREKYDFRDEEKGLEVLVPSHLSDMIKEGEAMHNCVGTYAAKVARADTDVVFVRRIEKPGESYITVEVDPRTGTIRQAREKYNMPVKGDNARDFMAAFAAHAARAARKYKAMGKSPKSEEGRKAE